VQNLLYELAERLGPVSTLVLAAFFLIVGITVLIHPMLLAWLVGIGLILAAVAVASIVFMSNANTVQR